MAKYKSGDWFTGTSQDNKFMVHIVNVGIVYTYEYYAANHKVLNKLYDISIEYADSPRFRLMTPQEVAAFKLELL